MTRLTFIALSLLVVSVLPACTALPIALKPPLDWQTRQEVLTSLNDWRVSGRVAMQSTDESWSASIDWDQANGSYEIRLSGPLGGNILMINGGPGYAIMVNSDGEKFIETSAGRLIEAQTGWRIPVEGLRYWALALTEPDLPADRVFDEDGRLLSLKQAGWSIEYKDYLVKDNIEMPRRIQMDNEHIRVKLLITEWQLGQRES